MRGRVFRHATTTTFSKASLITHQVVHPLQKNVNLTQGEDELTKYYCGNKMNPHLFCKHCGSVMMTDLTALGKIFPGELRYTVNVRSSSRASIGIVR